MKTNNINIFISGFSASTTPEGTVVASKDPSEETTVFTPGSSGMTTSKHLATEILSTAYSDVVTMTLLSPFPTTKSSGIVPTSQYGRTTSKPSRTMATSSSSQVTTISNQDLSTQQPDVPLSTPHFTSTKPLAGSSKVTTTTSTDTKTTVWHSNTSPTLVLPVSGNKLDFY